MGKYLLRRLILLIPTLIGMSLLIFVMVRLLPGDFVDALIGMDPQVTEEAEAELRRVYGLDASVPIQYARWVGEVLRATWASRSAPASRSPRSCSRACRSRSSWR